MGGRRTFEKKRGKQRGGNVEKQLGLQDGGEGEFMRERGGRKAQSWKAIKKGRRKRNLGHLTHNEKRRIKSGKGGKGITRGTYVFYVLKNRAEDVAEEHGRSERLRGTRG